MQWSNEQIHWLVKVLHPERTVASLPGGATLPLEARAALLGLEADVYAAERARLLQGAREAARELLAEPMVRAMVDRIPLEVGAKVVAFGDSHTADPQSWAVILNEIFLARSVLFMTASTAPPHKIAASTDHGPIQRRTR